MNVKDILFQYSHTHSMYYKYIFKNIFKYMYI